MTKAKKPESVADILKRRKAITGKTKIKTTKKKTAPKKAVKVVKKQTPKNAKDKNILEKLNSNMVGLRNPAGYLELIDFLGTPPHLREYDTQAELAKQIGVDTGTLSDWKKREGFWEDVREKRKNYIREEMLTASISAMYRKILKEGGAPEVKLLHQLADEFVEKSEVTNKNTIKALSIERKEAILKNLQNWGKSKIKKDET